VASAQFSPLTTRPLQTECAECEIVPIFFFLFVALTPSLRLWFRL